MPDLLHLISESWKSLRAILAPHYSNGDSTTSAEDNFRLLAENSNDIIIRLDAKFVPVYVSPSVKRVVGWAPEELIGHSTEGLIHPDDLRAVKSAHQSLVDKTAPSSRTSFRVLRPDGSSLWVEGSRQALFDARTGNLTGAVLVMRDITDRKKLEDQLTEMAFVDGLTGLANRRHFDETLLSEWRRTLRDHGEMSLLLLDLDHFKEFNDLYGHQVGDDCLRAVAAALTTLAHRSGDMPARYGGEEFAVILSNTGATGAAAVAENIRAAVTALEIPHAGNVESGGRVTVSVGVATALSRAGGTIRMPEGLLSAADTALYKAKREGRNRIATVLLLLPDESSLVPNEPIRAAAGIVEPR